jgi:hypothetical protein
MLPTIHLNISVESTGESALLSLFESLVFVRVLETPTSLRFVGSHLCGYNSITGSGTTVFKFALLVLRPYCCV